MSIAETYKTEFKIYSYDEDTLRGQEFEDSMTKEGYNFTVYNSRGLLFESIEQELPHIFVLFYQPLNIKFHEMLTKIRQASDEVEVIVLGANQFWPGVSSLMDTGLVDDFWTWPFPDPKAFRLRMDQLIEKYVYKYIAEQRSGETASIVKNLEELQRRSDVESSLAVNGLSEALSQWGGTSVPGLQSADHLVAELKKHHPKSDFVFLKNYPARSQLLVTVSSFAKEGYFQGQNIEFNEARLDAERGEVYGHVRTLVEQTLSCDEFILQPVELASDFYGFLMGVNFEDSELLKKAARYLSLNLRNDRLEKAQNVPDRDLEVDRSISREQFPLALSREVSRARRLKRPVSLVILHLEYVSSEPRERHRAEALIKEGLREYDYISVLDEQRFALILPHCRYEDAAIKAENIRRQLVARGLKTQNTPLRLCSGVSEFPSLSQDSDSLIVDAQKACSQVLVSGKNKVCLYSATPDYEPEFVPQP